MDEVILTPREVARNLKLSKSKIYYLIQTRKIPHIRIGRNVRIRQTDLQDWLAKNSVPTTSSP